MVWLRFGRILVVSWKRGVGCQNRVSCVVGKLVAWNMDGWMDFLLVGGGEKWKAVRTGQLLAILLLL